MRRLALLASLLMTCTAAAHAADRNASPFAVPAQWSGLYAGGHIGYGTAKASADYALLGLPFLSGSETLDGAVYGGQLGYNFQIGAVVLGVETDLMATSQKANETRLCTAPTCLVPVTQSSDDSIPWLGTTRLRAGFSIGPILLYGTGGAGYGAFKSTQTLTTALQSVTTTTSEQRLAWVAGGGVEAALGARWSIRAEYLHIDAGNADTTYNLAGLGLVTSKARMVEDITRIGLNYRF